MYEARGWVKEGSHPGEQDFAEIATSESLCGEMTYACANCGVSAKALTGWNVKPATGNRPWRWLGNVAPLARDNGRFLNYGLIFKLQA